MVFVTTGCLFGCQKPHFDLAWLSRYGVAGVAPLDVSFATRWHQILECGFIRQPVYLSSPQVCWWRSCGDSGGRGRKRNDPAGLDTVWHLRAGPLYPALHSPKPKANHKKQSKVLEFHDYLETPLKYTFQ
jgi:hypothetical protein